MTIKIICIAILLWLLILTYPIYVLIKFIRRKKYRVMGINRETGELEEIFASDVEDEAMIVASFGWKARYNYTNVTIIYK